MVRTTSSARVLAAFLADPAHEQYGFGLMRSTGVKSGSLYPLLDRLVGLGWIEVRDEAIDEQAAGRPRRRLYRLTPYGQREATRELTAFARELGSLQRWLPSAGAV